MRSTNRLLGEVTRALRSNAQGEATDSVLQVPSLVLPTISAPFAMNLLPAAGQTPTSSFAIQSDASMAANVDTLMVTISEGVWEFSISHRIYWNNAPVADPPNCVARMYLQQDVNTVTLSRFFLSAAGLSWPVFNAVFKMTANPQRPINIRNAVSGATGVGTANALAVIIASRIL